MMDRRRLRCNRRKSQMAVAACLYDIGQSFHCRLMTGSVMHQNDIVPIFQSGSYALYDDLRIGISAGSIGGVDIPVKVFHASFVQFADQFGHRHFTAG